MTTAMAMATTLPRSTRRMAPRSAPKTRIPRERAYIGLGGNLGDPGNTIEHAIVALARLPGTALAARSPLYRSAPIGYLDQPAFVNAVAALDTTLTPSELLDALQAIEAAFGRSRSFKDAPRTLDLDLLLYGEVSMHAPRLTLPHPRMHERAFVLVPLADIAPHLVLAGHGAVRDLARALGDQRVEKL